MSALTQQADINRRLSQVRFGPKADILDGQIAALFDHLVGGEQKLRRNCQAQRLGGL
jgi:hypothetical protein